MAIICPDYRLLFLMAPRTACTAVGEVLCKELGGEFIPKEDIVDEHGCYVVQRKHSTLDQLLTHQIMYRETANAFLKVTTIRNPFDSLVSLYVKKAIRYQHLLDDPTSWVYRIPGYVDDMRFCRSHAFPEWIARRYAKGRSLRRLRTEEKIKRTLCLKRWRENRFTKDADVVMRFESLEDDFASVLERCGYKARIEIPRINRTKERAPHYQKYYDRRAQLTVQSVFAAKLRHYGYTF